MSISNNICSFILASIQNRPSHLGFYLVNRVKEFKSFKNKFKALLSKITQLRETEDFKDWIYDAFGGNGRYVVDDIEYALKHGLEIIDRLLLDLETVIKYAEDRQYSIKFFNYLVESLKRLNLEKEQETIKNIDKIFEETEERYSDLYNDWKKNHDYYLEDYWSIKEDSKILQKYIDALKLIKPKLLEQSKIYQQYYGTEYRPEHESVEWLYHTTAYVKELLKDGFLKETPKRYGLGGAGKNLISMTTDLYIAKEISRSLKEVIMIFKGELKWLTITDWIKKEGLNLDNFKKSHHFPPKNKEETLGLYRWYLAVSNLREDPVFMLWDYEGAINSYKNRTTKDVGILKCKVDMTNPKIEYHSGEREFRVPSEAVLEIKKL